MLRTLLKTAGGYGFAECESTSSLSEPQLEGRSGSRLLRRETSDFGIVEKSSRRAVTRLRSILQSDDVGPSMLILLAQIRPRLLYSVTKSSPKHIKLTGNLYDNCQMVFGTLLDFLTDKTDDQIDQALPSEKLATGNSSKLLIGAIAKFSSSLPALGDLHEHYGVEPAMAWNLCRPLIRAAMVAKEEANKLAKNDAKNSDEDSGISEQLALYLPNSDAMRNAYSTMVPKPAWKRITPSLYEAFFSHSLYDINCPEERYATEIARLNKEIERLNKLKKGGAAAAGTMSVLAAAAAAAGGTDREIREALVFSKDNQMELERVTRSSEVLSSDHKRQMTHCTAVRESIKSESKALFPSLDDNPVERHAIEVFITYCVYPRCLLSPEDAVYCAHFITLLHELDTPGFSTLTYFDCLISTVAGGIYSVTEDEAGNLSLMLEETWKILMGWRYTEKNFEKDVAGKVRYRYLVWKSLVPSILLSIRFSKALIQTSCCLYI